MKKMTTIQVTKDVLNSLKKLRIYSRQPYNDLIEHMVKIMNQIKKNNQYDEFLHKIQQPKMKELWDNEDDEAWEKI